MIAGQEESPPTGDRRADKSDDQGRASGSILRLPCCDEQDALAHVEGLLDAALVYGDEDAVTAVGRAIDHWLAVQR